MELSDEFEKWLRVDPELKFPKWVKSEEGRLAILLLVVAGVYLGALLLALNSWNG